MRFLLAARLAACAALFVPIVSAQIIPFESNGLLYKTLTKGGVTVMFAYLPAHLREYSIMQVSLANGSPISWTVKPEDFSYRQPDGTVWQASPALSVVNNLLAKAGRHDVIKLVTTYERGVYGNEHMQTTNGYESRRQSALAEGVSARLKAGAAASAAGSGANQASLGRIHRRRHFLPQQRPSAGRWDAGGSYRRRNFRIPLRWRAGEVAVQQ